jgi:CDP-diglyceride synthetase
MKINVCSTSNIKLRKYTKMDRVFVSVLLFAMIVSCPESMKGVQLLVITFAGLVELLYTMCRLMRSDTSQVILMCMNPLMLYSFLYIVLILTSYATYEYCSYHFFHVEMRSWEQDVAFLHFMLIYNSVSDAAQYACARLWVLLTGRPTTRVGISVTNKSYQGYIGGLVVPFVVYNYNTDVMVLLNVLGMVGGLFSSYIKRCMRVKHWGSCLGPHGGVNDRLDSFLLPACIVMIGACRSMYKM